jgi:hypothetical protein
VKFTTPAVGEEQVVDIELDKATVLMPIRTNYTPVDAKVLWNMGTGQHGPIGSIDGNKVKDGAQAEPTEGKRIVHRRSMQLYLFCDSQGMQKS